MTLEREAMLGITGRAEKHFSKEKEALICWKMETRDLNRAKNMRSVSESTTQSYPQNPPEFGH